MLYVLDHERVYYFLRALARLLYNYQLSTRPNLKIDNKLKSKRDKASIVSAIFCGDIRQFNMFEFLIFNFEFDRRSYQLSTAIYP